MRNIDTTHSPTVQLAETLQHPGVKVIPAPNINGKASKGALSPEDVAANSQSLNLYQTIPKSPTTAFKLQATNGLNVLDDVRIKGISPLIAPQILMEDLPVPEEVLEFISRKREEIERAVRLENDRLVVVVGPCSIHDPKAAIEYAVRLKEYADKCRDDLLIVMRVYFEKPRTTVGWKGLINDPFLDGSFQINKGLRIARSLLLEINTIGLPCGCEFLDTISPQYFADLVSWGAIGARTTESQIHRELASGTSVAVGFKNGTDGSIGIALDAMKASEQPHHFLSVTKQGLSAIVHTSGNPSTHIILRGGSKTGPNYSSTHVADACAQMTKTGFTPRIMIDCSHDNSKKLFSNQPAVAKDVANQLVQAPHARNVVGVMIESHLHEGKQNLSDAKGACGEGLKYGVSITDGCIGWEETVKVLEGLREAVRARRAQVQPQMDDD